MLIPYKEYAKRYGFRRPSEVKDHIERGRIAGVIEDSQCGYLLPENALIDHVIPKKKDRTVVDNAFNLLRALLRGRNVNATILQMRPVQYESLLITLIDAELIRRDREELPFDSGLSLTDKGMRVAEYKKPVFTKLWRAMAAGVVEGVGQALVSTMLAV